MQNQSGVNWPIIGVVFGALLLSFLGAKKVVEIVGKLVNRFKPTSNIFTPDAWVPVIAPTRFDAASRSAALYEKVIDQFQVASNPRYRKYDNKTWCNVFARDVAQNSVADREGRGTIPQWYSETADGPAAELNANMTHDWLLRHGPAWGWRQVSASEAQARANKGHPTVASWKNHSGGSGHIAVVRPETSGICDWCTQPLTRSATRGVVIAQAGSKNFAVGHIRDGFGFLDGILYFTTD